MNPQFLVLSDSVFCADSNATSFFMIGHCPAKLWPFKFLKTFLFLCFSLKGSVL